MRSLHHLFSLLLIGVVLVSVASATDILTNRGNNARTGLNAAETILTPANVASSAFQLLYNAPVDGQVYAQPLYVSGQRIAQGTHNVIYIATEHDSLYAFDADTGALYWRRALLLAGESPVSYLDADSTGNCTDLKPEIGVTATPVIDRSAGSNGTIFVLAAGKKSDNSSFFHRLYAIDLSTGQDRIAPRPIVASITPPTGPAPTFVPRLQRSRPGLLLLNRIIYTSWASYCDTTPYAGWIIAYHENDLAQAAVLNTDPNGTPTNSSTGSSGNAIWQSGNGPAVDASGNIYVSTGNGPFDGSSDWGDTVLKLAQPSGGSLSMPVLDYFTPWDQQTEADQDTDLGSGGPMAFDLRDNTNFIHHLLVAAGKDWNLYLLDRDNMGKISSSDSNQRSKIYQEVSNALQGGVWSSPAFFRDQNGNVFIYYGGGSENTAYPLWQFEFDFTTNPAKPVLKSAPVHSTTTKFGFPGATPTISSNGSSNGIVWAYESHSGQAVLHAYDATNVATELFNSSKWNIGARVKFAVPTVCNGKVFVGTSNSIAAFGLPGVPPPTPTPTPVPVRADKDFNGDGFGDLVFENVVTGHHLVWLLQNGVHVGNLALPTTPLNWSIVGVGDFLGDKRAGLVMENSINLNRKIWILNDGAVQSQIWLPSAHNWRVGAAADFNGDGQADLVLENIYTGARMIWFLRGGLFSSSRFLPRIGVNWHIVGAGDFLGNGQADLVLENLISGERSIWFLNNGFFDHSISLGKISARWHIGGAVDFNGDGQADLVLENATINRRSIWILRNGGFSSNIILPQIGINWRAVDH